MTYNRWCIQCGREIKGISGLQFDRIKDEAAEKIGLKNPQYQYVHISCEEAFEANLNAGREKFLLSYIPKGDV